jgi:mRNA interferase MazF
MTNYKFGDVVLVPFPFSNLTQYKKRPAVIISSAAYQQARPDCVLLAITSQVRDFLGYAEAYVNCWQEAGLLKPSLFKPLIFTLEKTDILWQLGTLTAADQQTLCSVLQQIIQVEGLARIVES